MEPTDGMLLERQRQKTKDLVRLETSITQGVACREAWLRDAVR